MQKISRVIEWGEMIVARTEEELASSQQGSLTWVLTKSNHLLQ